MENNNQTQGQQRRVRIQRVKNYDAENINAQEKGKKEQKEAQRPRQSNDGAISKTKKQEQGEVSGWSKLLIGLTYVMGLSSILYFLSSAWIFLGTISIVFSLAVFLLSKKSATKEASGKVFFVSLCATIVSMLFWVLFLTTRRYGIGFLSSLFRAIQIGAAVVSALLVLYYFIEFASGGRFKINWISSITEKTEQKFARNQAAK